MYKYNDTSFTQTLSNDDEGQRAPSMFLSCGIKPIVLVVKTKGQAVFK